MVSSAGGAAGAARSLGACHRTEPGVRRPCGKDGISLPWMRGCGAGRTGVAAVRVTVTHAGSHSGVWLWLAQGWGCSGASGQPELKEDCTTSFVNRRRPCSHWPQQKTVPGSALWQPQQVEGRCAKSGRRKALFFQKAWLCLSDPHRGPLRGRGQQW